MRVCLVGAPVYPACADTRSTSKRVIYAALGGNLLVARTKFVAAVLTGRAAMLSEAIYSTVDSGNQLSCCSA
jgi:divalent metal cation (Fe/Co/Zn/Cd) transporter